MIKKKCRFRTDAVADSYTYKQQHSTFAPSVRLYFEHINPIKGSCKYKYDHLILQSKKKMQFDSFDLKCPANFFYSQKQALKLN